MNLLSIIIIFSTIIWFLVDRCKDSFWGKYSWGKWCTLAASGLLSIACTFCFSLDIVYALEIVNNSSIMGKILTVLILMSGSSGVSEIIQRIRG